MHMYIYGHYACGVNIFRNHGKYVIHTHETTLGGGAKNRDREGQIIHT